MNLLSWAELGIVTATSGLFLCGLLYGGIVAHRSWSPYIKNLEECVKTQCGVVGGTSNDT